MRRTLPHNYARVLPLVGFAIADRVRHGLHVIARPSAGHTVRAGKSTPHTQITHCPLRLATTWTRCIGDTMVSITGPRPRPRAGT